MDDQIPFKCRQIIVPVDMLHQDLSKPALAAGAWLAQQGDAKLHCLTVVRPLGASLTEMPEAKKPSFISYVADQSVLHGYHIEPHFRSHESFEHVLHILIESLGIDLVVMSTHPPKLKDYVLGSHSTRSMLYNKCNFLVLR